jgi:peptidyl-dipeptidase Dcp
MPVSCAAARRSPPQTRNAFTVIDARLLVLSVEFGQNVLAATAGWVLDLGLEDLAGLPPAMCDAAAGRAAAKGQAGR